MTQTATPVLNVERIRHLADVIEKVPHAPDADVDDVEQPPSAFNMLDWHCGSAACIGGWVEHLYGASYFRGEALGMSEGKAMALFLPFSSKEKLRAITPSQAARTLRKLADTGKVDWSHVKQQP